MVCKNITKANPTPQTPYPPDQVTMTIVDSGASGHMRSTSVDLTEVTALRGEISTAAEGETMKVVAQGRDEMLPGQVLVVEGLDVPLISFHGMEAGGYTYARHPREHRLRCWKKEGRVVPNLTFCVYPNNIALWHRDGDKHQYPREFPQSLGAYKAVEGGPVHHRVNEGTTHTMKPEVASRNPYGRLEVEEGEDDEETGDQTHTPVHRVEEPRPAQPGVTKSHRRERPNRKVHFTAEPQTIIGGGHTIKTATARRHPPARRGTRRQQPAGTMPVQGVDITPRNSHFATQTVEPQVASRNPYAALEVEEGEEDNKKDEENGDHERAGETARRASKLWTTVHAGDGRFNVILMHAATHMGEKRMVEMVENDLLINAPASLTAKAIRAHFPTQCLPCIAGKAKKANRDRKREGNATGRREVPSHQRHRDGCCERMTDPMAAPTEREIGDVVAIDDIDWAGGAEENRWATNRYILASVDLATGKFAGGEVHGGKDAESCLAALDKLITRYENAGHPIKKIRCDHQFGDIIAKRLEERGIGVEHSCPYEHETNGDIERFNQTLENHLRAMMAGRDKDCPYWWPEALEYFLLMWNASSVVKHGVSAHSKFYGTKLDYSAMPILPWGCAVEALTFPKPTNNAEPRTRSGFFLGCAQKHFRCARIIPRGGSTDAEILTRRSYWAEAKNILAAEEGDETRRKIEAEVWTLSDARKWFGSTPGLDYRLTREE